MQEGAETATATSAGQHSKKTKQRNKRAALMQSQYEKPLTLHALQVVNV